MFIQRCQMQQGVCIYGHTFDKNIREQITTAQPNLMSNPHKPKSQCFAGFLKVSEGTYFCEGYCPKTEGKPKNQTTLEQTQKNISEGESLVSAANFGRFVFLQVFLFMLVFPQLFLLFDIIPHKHCQATRVFLVCGNLAFSKTQNT